MNTQAGLQAECPPPHTSRWRNNPARSGVLGPYATTHIYKSTRKAP